jgi:hypothetical protein
MRGSAENPGRIPEASPQGNFMEGNMVKSRGHIWGFTLMAILCAGCATQPMTKNVINDIGGITDITRFQYYLSANVRLTATERVREPDFDKKGEAVVKETAYRNIVLINKNTKGVLMDSTAGEDGLLTLEVCFEENAADSDKRILFKQEGPGLEHKFYIVYTDPKKRLIQYGDMEYGLETNTGERAFLNIKINKSEIEKKRVRRVKGRRIEY